MSYIDGRSLHYLYNTYIAMRARCYKPQAAGYINYGGRGIAVCDRWLNDYWAFAADMGNRPVGATLDRIDNDGNYEPSNCRWATREEQVANRRPFGNVMLRAPQCPEGHAMTPDNIAENIPGRRLCRICRDATVARVMERVRSGDRFPF